MKRKTKKVVDVNYKSMAPEKLNPKEHPEINSYKKSFMEAINDPSVKNIAVTGKYGAGKSTILESIANCIELRKPNCKQKIKSFFKSTDKENKDQKSKILWLSLACFSTNKEIKNDDPLWRSIEKSLVQQMLYIPANKDLPKSHYYKIEPASKIQNIINCIVGIIWVISFILLIGFGGINKKAFDILNVSGNAKHWILMTEMFLFFVSIILILWKLFRYANDKFEISKLSIGKSEFEINKNRSEFNKYFDEILYFFLQKKYSIVIFEDIDRFDDINVFEHLRELNNLLNNNEKLQEIYKKRRNLYPIKFVYAVRDDIFSRISNDDKENKLKNTSNIAELNTKFFEWIIPVIPFMTTSNSASYLLNRFSDNDNKEFNNLLQDISIYCEDVRTWASTINEFKLYQDVIDEKEDYNPQKLFSILFFKNMYPLQFGEFVRAKGSLYQVLYTEIYYDKLTDRLKKDLEVAKDEYSQIKNMDEQWVVSYFKSNLFSAGCSGQNHINNVNGNDLALNDITFDELQDLYNNSIVDKETITVSDFYHGNKQIPFDVLFKKSSQLDPALVFSNENSKNHTFAENLKKSVNKISQIKNAITDIERKSIFELIKFDTDNVIDEILEYDESCKSYLRFALSEGYIDETSNFYLATINSSQISEKDLSLVRKLRSGAPIKFSMEVDNVEKFISFLNDNDLNKPGIKLARIIQFGMYNISSNKKVDKAYKKAMEFVCNRNNKEYDENIAYILSNIFPLVSTSDKSINEFEVRKKLLKKFSKQQKYKWHINDEKIKINLYDNLLRYLDVADLEEIFTNTSDFIDYINNDKLNIGEIYLDDSEQAKNILSEDPILIKNIMYGSNVIHSDFIDYLIIEKKLQININTIPKIIEHYINRRFAGVSYELIINIANEKLQDFVDKNINSFITTKFELSDENQLAESKRSLILLLNKKKLEDNLKEKLIEAYEDEDLDFEEVPRKFATLIFSKNKYSFSWTNLEFIEKEDTFEDNELIKFVSRSKDFEKMKTPPSNKQVDLIRKAVNICSIKITEENEKVIKLVKDYVGYNQDSGTLNKMINLDLVSLSDKLVDSTSLSSNKSSLIKLSINKIVDDEETNLDDTEEKLLNKLELEDCLEILQTSDTSNKLENNILNKIANEYLDDLGNKFGNDTEDDQRILVATKFLKNYEQFGSIYLRILMSLDDEKDGNYELMIDLMNLTKEIDDLNFNLIIPYVIQNHTKARVVIKGFENDSLIMKKLYDMEIIGKYSNNGQEWTVNRKKLRKEKIKSLDRFLTFNNINIAGA